MRIEINAGGLGGALAVAEYQLNMSGFLSDAEDVISCFKTVKSEIYDLNGGVGTLQGAVDDLSGRIRREEDKLEAAEGIHKKSNEFFDLAIQVDKKVAGLVNRNRDEFYETNPWLKPPVEVEEEEQSWGEKAWSWLCGAGEEIAETVVEGAKEVWNWVKDTAKKAWDGLVEFYNEHKKIIDTVLLVVGAIAAIAAVIASGGGALIPLLTALGCSAGTAAAISGAVAVVAVVSTIASTTMNVVDLWAEIDDPTFQAWKKGLNFVSGVSNFVYSIGSIYNSFKGITPEQAKGAMKAATSGSGGRGATVNGEYVSFLSDYQPGADSAFNRQLFNGRNTNHFYSIDNPNGGKIYVSADPCTGSGVANVVGNSSDEFIVISGTHGGPNGGLSFNNAHQFYLEDMASFQNMPNVQVVNIQNHVTGLTPSGMVTGFNQPYFQNIFSSGKNIVCAWCYSDRSMLVKQLLGVR